MGMVNILIGGVIGFGCQMMSNGVRKIPLSRQPWLHLMASAGGMYFAYKLPLVELALVEDINKIRKDRGMGPLVGTGNWIKYSSPEDDLPFTPNPKY